MKIRIVQKTGELIGTGTLLYVNRPPRSPEFNCAIRFVPAVLKPIWYRPTQTYSTEIVYFSLPAGHENIWGQGYNRDTDMVQIHPEDLPSVLEWGLHPLPEDKLPWWKRLFRWL